ncbi:MAG: hypothetical protein HC880_08715 [Bacteroidia bacterium]|nr:hypothetical protein [Bacteroidia bacterium]
MGRSDRPGPAGGCRHSKLYKRLTTSLNGFVEWKKMINRYEDWNPALRKYE